MSVFYCHVIVYLAIGSRQLFLFLTLLSPLFFLMESWCSLTVNIYSMMLLCCGALCNLPYCNNYFCIKRFCAWFSLFCHVNPGWFLASVRGDLCNNISCEGRNREASHWAPFSGQVWKNLLVSGWNCLEGEVMNNFWSHLTFNKRLIKVYVP